MRPPHPSDDGGSPHDALLGLPGAHEPMPKDMLKKLKALNPDNAA